MNQQDNYLHHWVHFCREKSIVFDVIWFLLHLVRISYYLLPPWLTFIVTGIKQIKTSFDLKRSSVTVLRRGGQVIYLIMFLCVSFVLCIVVTSFISNSKAGTLLSTKTFQNNHQRSVKYFCMIYNNLHLNYMQLS